MCTECTPGESHPYAGYLCHNCYTPLGYRFVRAASPNSDCQLCRDRLMGGYVEGKARWYGNEYVGREMRNGEVYTADAMTCAVNEHLWPILAAKVLLICSDSACVDCIVTDTGDSVAFMASNTIVDLSPATFEALAGNLGVGVVGVRVWVRG